ncbi:type IV secretion system protein VirB10 [Verminephrobacter aporrectodeae]|uniref:type IV secretion system protein VirB10 n=1 Tax=Verminephrobacter aporrectodeae TaxID=1110389 RepID=UPI002238C5D4|nr:type IV secretion system protein VirB10 [Verminephrobacter aporrectodeae]
MDAKDDVLGAPTSRAKSKTNVGKFAILGMVLVGFLFIVAGILFYQKNRQASADEEKNNPLKRPGFVSRNSAVESDSIERTKAEIRKKQEEERAQAQIKAMEEAQARAKALADAQAAAAAAAAEAAKRGMGGLNKPPITERTPRERKMSGEVLLDPSGMQPKSNAQLSEKEQVQARLAAIGMSPSGAQIGMNPPNGAQGSPAGMSGQQPALLGSRQGSTDGLAGRLQPTVLQARSAGKLPNLDYLLKRGTIIPCALKTGIDTTLPGFVICNVLNNVYSANGKVLLVERGATVFGEQQSQLKQGQERTFVVWTRIDNPNGVFADIDSPATDQMGYSGISGYVDTHFWARFGGAIMLSLIQDFSQAYSQRTANGSNTASTATAASSQQYANTNRATQDMAAEALRNSINIPPTLVVLPATIVSVLVARDVSFENVFSVVE